MALLMRNLALCIGALFYAAFSSNAMASGPCMEVIAYNLYSDDTIVRYEMDQNYTCSDDCTISMEPITSEMAASNQTTFKVCYLNGSGEVKFKMKGFIVTEPSLNWYCELYVTMVPTSVQATVNDTQRCRMDIYSYGIGQVNFAIKALPY